MMREFLNSSWLSQAWNTMTHSNGLRNSTKMYSTATDDIVYSKPNSLRLSRTLIGDQGFVIVVLIALVCSMIQPTNSLVISSNYSGSFLSSSPKFSRPDGGSSNYYYHAIQVTVNTTGTYNFTSSSSINTYGYFYNDLFNPSYPSQNLMTSDDHGNSFGQFEISHHLEARYVYVMVVTTLDNITERSFSIIATGPNSVHMVSIVSISTTPSMLWPTRSTSITTSSTDSSSSTTWSTLWPTRSTPTTTSSTGSSSSTTWSTLWPTGSTPTTTSSTDSSSSTTWSTQWPTRSTSSSTASNTPILTTTTTSSPVTSTYSGSLDFLSPAFVRPNGTSSSSYYYDAIQVVTYTTATYTLTSSSSIDTYGCLYDLSFDPSNPSWNLITCDDDSGGDQQFLISYSLQYGRTYILVVTTYGAGVTGYYSAIAKGPATVDMSSFTPSTYYSSTTTFPTTSSTVTSTYSGSLSWSSPTFVRPNGTSGFSYYYDAIQVVTYTTATYTLTSSSSIDTYGCLYDTSFDPSNPSWNLITCDDDSGGSQQFLISQSLQYARTYILVVTTYGADISGSYWVIAKGPATVYMSSITPSTYYSSTTTFPTTSSTVTSTYSGSLSSSSDIFFRPNGSTGYYYYYEAIQVVTYTTDTYTLTSSSSIDTYGCLYDTSFNPSTPSINLITCDDDSGGSQQFLISRNLNYGRTYILVVTTYSNAITGSYWVYATGPALVSMTSIRPGTPTFSGMLSYDGPMFSRPNSYSDNDYYYQAIQTQIDTYGTYTLRSSSSINTYGCLYDTSFDPSNPSQNLVMCDDGSGGSEQFLISNTLQTRNTYILVVTTYYSGVTGSYSIIARGPGSVTMTTYTPSNSPALSTLQIVCISLGGVILFVVLLGVCIHRRKRQTGENQRLIPPRSNANLRRQNISRPNEARMPYTVPVSTSSIIVPEEPPPSYESYMSSMRPPEQSTPTP